VAALTRDASSAAGRQDQDRALEILEELERQHGATPETCGLLGRIHKFRWSRAVAEGKPARARGHLDDAIEAYVRGFRADWRQIYPGVNAVTLLDVEGSEERLAERDRLLPVVRFAAEERLRASKPDYWDWATALELAVLSGDRRSAGTYLRRASASVTETWQPGSTAANLRMITDSRRVRGEDVDWIDTLVAELDPVRVSSPATP
jgi:hypothetical protein